MPSKPYHIGTWLLLAALISLPFFVVWEQMDVDVSNLFYDASVGGFWLRDLWLTEAVHQLCQYGTRVVAAIVAFCGIYHVVRRKKLLHIDAKAAAFIIVTLLIGPGLVTNTIFKDFWGRARPYQIQEFGGSATYSAPLVIANQCDTNCSFFSGDGALGFSLHMLFYLVPPRWRRRTFWGGWFGGGLIFGGNRILTGSHFLSDVLYSGYFMIVVAALIHIMFYGWQQTRNCWRDVLQRPAISKI